MDGTVRDSDFGLERREFPTVATCMDWRTAPAGSTVLVISIITNGTRCRVSNVREFECVRCAPVVETSAYHSTWIDSDVIASLVCRKKPLTTYQISISVPGGGARCFVPSSVAFYHLSPNTKPAIIVFSA
jgi:hypothetical protein